MKAKVLTLLALALAFCTAMSDAKKVHTLGDSTMAPYDENATVTRGWGMYLAQFLTDGWTTINYARGGRDARAGYNELWQTAKKNVEVGDYVIIQFAHNDEKNGGMDGVALYNYYAAKGDTEKAASVDQRGTVPTSTYREYLQKIAQEAIALGAHPVFVGPICRAQWTGSSIRRSGRHDLGASFDRLTADGPTTGNSVPESDHSMDYAYQMAQLAAEMQLPFVDLTTATARLYESYGQEKTATQIMDGQGGTHLSATGGVLVARSCAQLMQEQGILADHITVPTDLSVSPATADLGETYKGLTLTKELTLNGFGLSPASGTITLSATEGIELSFNKQSWKQALSVDYQLGTLVQTFYVRVVLAQAGNISGTITVTAGQQSIEVPVTAKGLELSTGTPVSLSWPLSESETPVLSGQAIVLPETWVGMQSSGYQAIDGRTTQLSQPIGGAWTAAEDDDPARYISFGLQAADKALSIDHISMCIGAAGGDGLLCHVYYSTDHFVHRTTLWAPTAMTAGTLYEVSAQPVIHLESGEQIEVRIYPWSTQDATGKSLCLSEVRISGTEEGGSLENEPVTVTFPFNLGETGQTATFGPTEQAAAWFKTSYVQVGNSLTLTGKSTVDGQAQTGFTPTQKDNAANDDNALTFYFIPKQGLMFTPTKVSFKSTRYGTNGGKINASWVSSDGAVASIADGIIPLRNNATDTGHITEFSATVSGANASDGLCGLRLNLFSLDPGKTVAFSDIVIEGTLLGTAREARQCRLDATLTTDEAGVLTITPNATLFDEGDEITLSIAEHFGYHFAAWTSPDGGIVSTANPYTFTITDNTTLVGTFNKADTYALELTLTEGARSNLVDISPAGTFVDGKRMYEAGTEVRLTAHNNKVLTFVGWEDQSTDAERTVKMTANRQLTARFSAADYIVGWDFYEDQPAQERAADYRSDSENAGLLSLHNAEGTTSSWLTRGIGNGQENNRYAARIWKLRSQGLYFEISFSTVGYKNIRVSSALGCSYNTYSTNHLQYSIDGKNYTTVETFNITARGWFDKEDVALPADADEQPRVYVRWMPDRESDLVGAETDYDGLAITDIFITADQGALADEQATIVSTTPAHDATGVSRNGSIILSFDNKIKAGQGGAFITAASNAPTDSQQEAIAPIISGKSAIFKYGGLQYGASYTFHLPDGVLTSRSGHPVPATQFTFTTMERSQPEARLYDAVVAQDGSGDYTTVQAAIDAAPTDRARPWLIFIKNGQYEEHVDIPKNKSYLHLIGQDRDLTIIKDHRLSGGDQAVHVSIGATVVVNADNIFFENLTMENSYGHEQQAGPQALALNTGGDRIAMNHVALLSYQDTWITTSNQKNRHYIRHSLIEGAVDFIYNGGDVYLDGDTLEINRPSGGYIVAPNHTDETQWGYVFQNNIIRPGKDFKTGNPLQVTDVWLGRPWHGQPKTVFINTQTYVNLPAKGWYNTMGGLPSIWADYNTVDANGNPVDLSQREDTYYYTDGDGNRVYGTAKNYLTAEEAAQYTLRNVMSGSDNWQPELLCEACEAPVITLQGETLTWNAVPYAICYVVTRNGKVVAFTTDITYPADTEEALWQVQAVNEYGGLSPKASHGTLPASISTATLPLSSSHQTIYGLDGTRLQAPRRGLNILRLNDGSVRKQWF